MNPQDTEIPAPIIVPESPLAKFSTLVTSSWNFFVSHWKILVPIIVLPTVLFEIAARLQLVESPAFIISGIIVFIIGIIASIASFPAGLNAVDTLAKDSSAPVTFQGQYKIGFTYFCSYFFVSALLTLSVMGGVMLLVLPGILISILAFFATYIVVIENKKGISALTESYSIVKGRGLELFYRLLGFGLIMALVSILLNFLISLIGSLPDNSLSMIIGALLSIIGNGLMQVLTVIYTYHLYITFRATRLQNIPTDTFNKVLKITIGLAIIGIIAIITFGSIFMRQNNISFASLIEAYRNSSYETQNENDINIDELRKMINERTGSSSVPVQQ
ncbi:MAG: hypothetical protein M3Q80_01485 [bacterium]|nr:hypothetical protein [bacterium]